MKHSIHYQVEYKLVSGGGILRGEIGAMTCIRLFDEYQPDEAIRFVNQYQCYKCENIYNLPCEIRSCLRVTCITYTNSDISST